MPAGINQRNQQTMDNTLSTAVRKITGKLLIGRQTLHMIFFRRPENLNRLKNINKHTTKTNRIPALYTRRTN